MKNQDKTDHVRVTACGGASDGQSVTRKDVLVVVIACLVMAAFGGWAGSNVEPKVSLMTVLILGPVFALGLLARLASRQWHGRARRLAVPGCWLVLLILFGLIWWSLGIFV